MATPFEAIVWGRVLPLDTFDQAQIMAFFNQWGERTNPEKQCAVPSALPSAAPSGSLVPEVSSTPPPTTTPAPSVAPPTSSAAPSAS